jgi:hypothetical protein
MGVQHEVHYGQPCFGLEVEGIYVVMNLWGAALGFSKARGLYRKQGERALRLGLLGISPKTCQSLLCKGIASHHSSNQAKSLSVSSGMPVL